MQNCTRVQVDFPAYKAKLYERAKGNFPVGLESPRYILIPICAASGGMDVLRETNEHNLKLF